MLIICESGFFTIPLHRYGTFHSSILEDKDFSNKLQLHLTEIAKKGYI
jgi:hypothetical protein